MPISDRIAVDRALTHGERELVAWLLHHAAVPAHDALPQLDRARVAARCGCGCGCIDFRIRGTPRSTAPAGIQIVSDYWWRTRYGHLCGAFLFLVGGRLTGLDVWSIDGHQEPDGLPQPSELWPYPPDGLDQVGHWIHLWEQLPLTRRAAGTSRGSR